MTYVLYKQLRIIHKDKRARDYLIVLDVVSVIIPVYNRDRYVEQTINSVLDQTYDNIEIILIDDCSTDNSLSILQKYVLNNENIRLISRNVNGGVGAVSADGISAASGEWIKFLGSDDVLTPTSIADMISYVQNIPNKTNTIFYAGFDFMDVTGKKITYASKKARDYDDNHLTKFDRNVKLLYEMIDLMGTSICHKSLFDRYGNIDRKLRIGEGWDFFMRCCILNDCVLHYIDKKFMYVRQHDQSITTTANIKYINEQTTYIRERILNLLPKHEKIRYEKAILLHNKKNMAKTHIKEFMIKSNLYGIYLKFYNYFAR